MRKAKSRTSRPRPRVAASTPAHTKPASPPASSPPNAARVPHLMTVDEVAEMLRTTRKAVYALIYKGALPGVVRLSRRLLIDRGDLVEWINQSRSVSLTTQGAQ